MDSFYDHPRPNVFLNKNLELNVPILPEVTKASLLITDSAKDSICQNSKQTLTGRLTSYNIWRAQNEQKFLQKSLNSDSNSGNNGAGTRPIATNTTPVARNNNEPFEKLYLANLPKRQLDRSLNEAELRAAEFSHSSNACQKNISLSDAKNPNPNDLNSSHLQKILDKLEALNTSQEPQYPTIQELFKVIEKKDEQIRSLENQVETLLKINTSFVKLQEQHMITIGNQNRLLRSYSKPVIKKTKKSVTKLTKNKKKLQKKIDKNTKMTSLKNGNNENEDEDNDDDDDNDNDTDDDDDDNDDNNHKISSDDELLSSSSSSSTASSVSSSQSSSVLNRFRNLSDQENRSSSVHFSMDANSHLPIEEYQSEEECTNYRRSKNNDAGFTFYDNIMGQVNRFLENTANNRSSLKKRTTPIGRGNDLKKKNKSSTKTQKKNSCGGSSSNNNNQQNDVSAVVRKVLVQYLPQLKQQQSQQQKQPQETNRIPKTNAAAVEPSFTTLQYQEKYCLFQSQFESPDNQNYFGNVKPTKNRYSTRFKN